MLVDLIHVEVAEAIILLADSDFIEALAVEWSVFLFESSSVFLEQTLGACNKFGDIKIAITVLVQNPVDGGVFIPIRCVVCLASIEENEILIMGS